MSNIRPHVRTTIQNFLESQEGYHSKEDVLRVIEEEAMLMKETQHIVDMLDSDPMEQFACVRPHIEHLKRIIRVISCTRIRTTNDYCRVDAVVGFEKCNNLQLTFRYERKRRQDEDKRISRAGFHIRYSIEMSINHQQRENLIVVEVWADKNYPSIQKAVCINQTFQGPNDSEEGWEDIEEDNNGRATVVELTTKCIEEAPPKRDSNTKKQPLNQTLDGANDDADGWEDIEEDNGTATVDELTTKNSKETPPQKRESNAKRQKLNDSREAFESDRPTDEIEDDSDEPDSYLAYLDPDVLHQFLEISGIQSLGAEMHEGTAFFLLMTFPFYEHEWDLVGYLFEEIFGDGDED